MTRYKTIGQLGELEVIEKILCPICKNKLILLPKDYPLYDARCTSCNFRVQIKTHTRNPNLSPIILGGGWDILEKITKAGFPVPPLMINSKWEENGIKYTEIRYYPSINKTNLIKRTANIQSKNRIYKMFNYNLNGLIFDTLYQEKQPIIL